MFSFCNSGGKYNAEVGESCFFHSVFQRKGTRVWLWLTGSSWQLWGLLFAGAVEKAMSWAIVVCLSEVVVSVFMT